jgi:hypothetical protein
MFSVESVEQSEEQNSYLFLLPESCLLVHELFLFLRRSEFMFSYIAKKNGATPSNIERISRRLASASNFSRRNQSVRLPKRGSLNLAKPKSTATMPIFVRMKLTSAISPCRHTVGIFTFARRALLDGWLKNSDFGLVLGDFDVESGFFVFWPIVEGRPLVFRLCLGGS